MANGFITLENGEHFVTRWTGYDMILEIVTKELEHLGNQKFADWLRTQFPKETEEKGDAVFWNSRNEMFLRTIDLRGLTKKNREDFWKALDNGAKELLRLGKEYSNLNPVRITELIALHSSVSDSFAIESETANEIMVSGETIDKIGPGW